MTEVVSFNELGPLRAALVGLAIVLLIAFIERVAQVAAGKHTDLGWHRHLAAYAIVTLIWAVLP